LVPYWCTFSYGYTRTPLSNNISSLRDSCSQHFKNPSSCVQVGELPPKNLTAQPLDEVSFNLVGPWKLSINGFEYEFFGLTAVDPLLTY
jgi:hypothetical protein